MEKFSFCQNHDFSGIRNKKQNIADYSGIGEIAGSDIDPSAIELAKRHIKQAGLEHRVSCSVLPLQQVNLNQTDGVFVTNPPYGERLSDRDSSRKLYGDLRLLAARHPGWSMCVISSDPGFEKAYGMRAHKKGRLYNGRLECTYYIYFGTRTPESC